MADAFAKYEAACKVAGNEPPNETTTDIAILASADAIVSELRTLTNQLVASTEALTEAMWDFMDFDGDEEDEEDYDYPTPE